MCLHCCRLLLLWDFLSILEFSPYISETKSDKKKGFHIRILHKK